MNYIIRSIAYIGIMTYKRIKNKSVKFEFASRTSLDSRFEGYNKLSHHSFFSGEMGFASYIGSNSIVGGKIGRFCSIASNVTFLSKTHPVQGFISSHPSFYSIKKQCGFSYVNKQKFNEEPMLSNCDYSIEVGNDVYIGYGATIIGPCRIGDGAVIAAGAVVTGDVPDYAIVGGVPAKIIKYRFSKDDISFLQSLKWWNKPSEWIKKYSNDFDSVYKLKRAIKNKELRD